MNLLIKILFNVRIFQMLIDACKHWTQVKHPFKLIFNPIMVFIINLLIKWGLKYPKIYTNTWIQISDPHNIRLEFFIEYFGCLSA